MAEQITLDKTILAHIKKMDKIEDMIDKEIDALYNNINIDDVIADPEGTLMGVVGALSDIMQDKYYPMAVEEGIKFGKELEDEARIVVPDSNDPKLNEDLEPQITGEVLK